MHDMMQKIWTKAMEAKNAYNSDAYQAAVRILDGGAVRDMRIVEAAE